MYRRLTPSPILVAVVVLVVLGRPAHAETPARTRPNIVFILIDDMGYGDLGGYGGKFTPTPNLDLLAQQGIRFRQFYVASPICSPVDASTKTSQLPTGSRVGTITRHARWPVPPSVPRICVRWSRARTST